MSKYRIVKRTKHDKVGYTSISFHIQKRKRLLWIFPYWDYDHSDSEFISETYTYDTLEQACIRKGFLENARCTEEVVECRCKPNEMDEKIVE